MWDRCDFSCAFLACSAVFGLASAPAARAETLRLNHSVEVIQESALALEDEGGDLFRLAFKPKLNARMGRAWRADIDLRLEGAVGDVGLGTDTTYADISQPLVLGPDARLEIDEATLSWRSRATRLTLGKQSVAWGVLDGLQVTDRFDATRRREAVFIEHRPDRLSRWGARAEFEWAGVRWDAAMALDGTVDQLALPGDTFASAAPRFRAGLPVGAPTPEISVDVPNQPTLGLRAARRFGASDTSLLVISGPDTEPAFRAAPGGVTLTYDTRTLLGATWQRGAGSKVMRMEAAWIADQPVNIEAPVPTVETRARWLAGFGLDWDMAESTFLNAQIGVDHVEGDRLVRPSTDVIATVRLQKSLANDTWKLSAEMLGSLSDGDGTFRPAVSWQVSDQLRLSGGVDVIWGDASGLFGQFDEADRAWLRASWAI